MICINKKCNKEIPDDALYCQWCGKKQEIKTRKTKSRGNGLGTVFQLPSGKWQAEVTMGYVNNKRIRRTKSNFRTKKEALEYIPILKGAPSIEEITIANLYEKWSKTHFANISKSKETAYVIAYKRLKDIQFKKISDLRLEHLQAVVDETANTYYPKRDMKVLLNQIYKYAMQNDYCNKNYAEFIKLPPLEKSNKDAFTTEEIDKLWKDYEAGNKFTGYILVMIYTGTRYGEISTILKENVDLENRCMIGGIKTDAGKNRQIPIAIKILPIVTELYQNGKKKLLEMNEDNFYKQFKETLERLSVRPLTPHCCRHTFSTLMANADIQPAIIKETAGHKNYSTTLGYTHIKLDEKLNAVDKL